MEEVLKVGGSLIENVTGLLNLCQKLSELSRVYKIAVVPGGGEFADIVRRFNKIYSLSDKIAHKMAILAMDQYGLLLSNIIPGSFVSHMLKEISESTVDRRLSVFLPSRFMFSEDPLENSWDVTSDSIAACIAGRLHAKKLVLITDVDGIFSEDPKKSNEAELIKELSAEMLLSWDRRTSVDKQLAKVILETKLDCYVVNGNYPERIRDILENKNTICTHVTVG